MGATGAVGSRKGIVLSVALGLAAVPVAALAPMAAASHSGCVVRDTTRATIPSSFSSLQSAVSNSSVKAGDTLKVSGVCKGDTTISKNLTIHGHRHATLNGGNSSSNPGSVVTIPGGVTVTITGLIITGGDATQGGGGIFDKGTLILTNATVVGNSAGAGGGIANAGATVTLNHTDVVGNTAALGGGGVFSGSAAMTPAGMNGTTTIENHSEVDGNSTPTGGGGGILNRAGALTLVNSHVDHNTALNGGGIASGNGQGGATGSNSTVVVTHSTVNDNTATGGGGGPAAGGIANGDLATITNSEVNGNTGIGGLGGGIFNHGTMTITGTHVIGNAATTDASVPPNLGFGGGIGNANVGVPGSGILTVNKSEVRGNSASGAGGGIGNLTNPMAPSSIGSVTLKNDDVKRNSSPYGGGIVNQGMLALGGTSGTSVNANTATFDGGGIFNFGGTMSSTNASVNGNTVTSIGDPAGLGVQGAGGGIVNLGGAVTLGGPGGPRRGTSVNGNTAPDGGGIWNNQTLNLTNASVNRNTATTGNGGGIDNQGTLHATNTDIRHNAASAGLGGGIYNAFSVTLTTSVSINANAATNGGGIFSTGTLIAPPGDVFNNAPNNIAP
jgi:hypothetical protein